jgi:hypothetical protein
MRMLDVPLAAHMPNSNRAVTVSKDLGNKDELEFRMHHSEVILPGLRQNADISS